MMFRKGLLFCLCLLVMIAFIPASAQEVSPEAPAFSDEKFAYIQMLPVPDADVIPLAGPAGNTIYQVFVSNTNGTYTARTGSAHPQPGRNVLFGGSSGSPGTSFTTVRSFTTGTDYVQAGGNTTTFTRTLLNPYLTSTDPIGTTGFRSTWLLPGPGGSPASRDHLQIVQDVNVIGDQLVNSRIEVRTQVTNLGNTPVSLGIRYLWDYQIGSDDGPSFTRVNPDGPAQIQEATFAPPTFSFYDIKDNNTTSSPTFSVSGTALGPTALAPSPLTSLKFVCWPAAINTTFDYTTTGANCSTGGGDTAVLYYIGETANSAVTVSPGQQFTFSQYLFAVPPNIEPVAVDDTANTTVPNPVTINVLANDIELNGDPLTVTSVTAPAQGTAVINADNTVTYTPNGGAVGSDSFVYTISDGTFSDSATVTIIFNNQAPFAVDDSATTNVNTPVTIPVLANDSDPNNDVLTVTQVSAPTTGTASINADNTVTYTPPAGYVGAATFTYTVSDGSNTDTATVTVNVINRPPTAQDDTTTTFVNTPISIPVLANDSDPDGQALTVTVVSDPARGTATINADSSVTYTPDTNLAGNDTFTYTISDGFATASATVFVQVVNRLPVGGADAVSGTTCAPLTFNVLANDSDPDGQPLMVTAANGMTSGQVTINADYTLTYSPLPGGGPRVDQFQYSLSDGIDGVLVSVTITLVNCPPQANNDSITTPVNTAVTVTVLANDSDPDNTPLLTSAVGAPANGTAVINADNTVTYTPNTGFIGTDTFTYTISDGIDTATASVTVEVIATCTDPNPERDLDHEESLLLNETGYRTGRIVNRSQTCAYDVGLASYRMFDDIIDNQELFDSITALIGPGATLELTVDLPDCATQVDLFYGELLPDLNGRRYGQRLIQGIMLGRPNYCVRNP